jgi:hypothetical protein
MLENTRNPPCIKCKQPTSFHSIEIVRGKSGHETMVVFHCDRCNLLSAKSTGMDYPPPNMSRAS